MIIMFVFPVNQVHTVKATLTVVKSYLVYHVPMGSIKPEKNRHHVFLSVIDNIHQKIEQGK